MKTFHNDPTQLFLTRSEGATKNIFVSASRKKHDTRLSC